ncbi:hypothetical protein ANCCAN_07135 [Ancylostoma caninum]|uniref:Uncharacterized protein n=1 Tax=Ancylostoma caninum TaxID=29170 RepID=A0A368GR20_ANCCA|nr:hypothetical protein ANCCAN_07135 [Ancylostoma caninum]
MAVTPPLLACFGGGGGCCAPATPQCVNPCPTYSGGGGSYATAPQSSGYAVAPPSSGYAAPPPSYAAPPPSYAAPPPAPQLPSYVAPPPPPPPSYAAPPAPSYNVHHTCLDPVEVETTRAVVRRHTLKVVHPHRYHKLGQHHHGRATVKVRRGNHSRPTRSLMHLRLWEGRVAMLRERLLAYY